MLGCLALSAGVVPAQASTVSRLSFDNKCTTGAMITCASVQIRFVRPGDQAAPMLSIGLRNLSEISTSDFSPEPPIRGFGFDHVFSQSGVTMDRPNILARNIEGSGRTIECRPGGLDCREVNDPTTTTPEPVTMTLVATGLVGMGIGRLRRRKATNDLPS
ncbi:MAG: hypothetical protein ABI679_03545 [Gemmatimonadota bacterium]